MDQLFCMRVFTRVAELGAALLFITHRRVQGKETVANVMGGWDVHTGIHADLLAGQPPRPFWKAHTKAAQEYAVSSSARPAAARRRKAPAPAAAARPSATAA